MCELKVGRTALELYNIKNFESIVCKRLTSHCSPIRSPLTLYVRTWHKNKNKNHSTKKSRNKYLFECRYFPALPFPLTCDCRHNVRPDVLKELKDFTLLFKHQFPFFNTIPAITGSPIILSISAFTKSSTSCRICRYVRCIIVTDTSRITGMGTYVSCSRCKAS